MKSILKPHLVVLIFVSVISGLVACSKKQSTLEWLGGEDERIFSDRPQSNTTFLAVLKLETPPLLTTVVRQNGKAVINVEQAKAIEAEQAQLLADLKALSSDIRVLYRYKMVLNGVAIVAPISLADKIKTLSNVAYTEAEGTFGRPVLVDSIVSSVTGSLTERNSVKFISADKVHALGATGKGIKVGIIDTGIDYTHSMFGGAGTEEAYKTVDPSKESSSFPNAKVVGGIDLVGTEYSAGSGDFSKRIPKPDLNPLDEGGHGTHVAGTVAGIGDYAETYSGVAPDAELYAIKVFGAKGSTGDAVVIAGLEYAADPNKDGDLTDQLHVVNLSLGSPYGIPHMLYSEAVGNLSKGGTFVVASAGNSGPTDYITGAPGTVDEALSVAASIDDTFHNWNFGAVRFETAAGDKVVEAIEAAITKPIAEAGAVSGKLVYIGLGDKELTPEQLSALRGNIAFADRGVIPFADKFKRAVDGGAIGVVVANNQPGNPMVMGGEGKFDVPAIMVTQEMGLFLKEQLAAADVVIHFQTPDKVQKPELIDNLTGFSSKGPRSVDGFFKPEISAPGESVISADMGGGNKGIKLSGTSMAAPHMAGVMALVRQLHPSLNSDELKSLVMGTAVTISSADKQVYPLSRQGAGRVDALRAVQAQLVSLPAAVSLGEVNVETGKTFAQTVTIKNITAQKVDGELVLDAASGLKLLNPQQLVLEPGQSKNFELKLKVDASGAKQVTEFDGIVKVMQGRTEILRVPVLAVVKKIAQVQSAKLRVQASSEASAAGAVVTLEVANKGVHGGRALIFNLLGKDQRKQDVRHDKYKSRACDLESVGYRVIDRATAAGAVQVLQVAAKLYEPMTTWNPCQISVLIDANGDQVAEQELAGLMLGDLAGISDATNSAKFGSVLLDAAKAREIRRLYELAAKEPGSTAKEDYSSAVVDLSLLSTLDHSTIMVLEADVSKLVRRASGELAIKVASLLPESSAVEADDFLGSPGQWKKLSLSAAHQPFAGIPEEVQLPGGQSKSIEFRKGEESGSLLVLYPDNRTSTSVIQKDSQAQILRPQFGF